MTLLQSGLAKSLAVAADYSCRFNEPDGSDLTRTWGTATSLTTWTISFWVKRSNLGAEFGDAMVFATAQTASGAGDTIMSQGYFSSGDAFVAGHDAGSFWTTTQVFRDTSSWYHMMMVCNTTETTDSDRLKLFVNGSQVTDFSATSYPDEDAELGWGKAQVHYIGENYNGGDTFGGYLAEFYYIDGQALTPASFGETNATTNQWVPIDYTGTYGNEGCYLKFQDSSALGDDSSGNTNDFTVTNLAATDQMLDSPTNNFATWNPLDKYSGITLAEGNTHCEEDEATATRGVRATFGMDDDKIYCEVLLVNAYDGYAQFGIEKQNASLSTYPGGDALGWGLYNLIIYYNNANTTVLTGTTPSVGDIIQLAYNGTTGKVWFGLNNTWYTLSGNVGVPSTDAYPHISGLTGEWFVAGGPDGRSPSKELTINFGQDSSFAGAKTAQGNQDSNGIGDFYYTPPTDFLALCSSNLSDPEIALPGEYFNPLKFTGTGGVTNNVTGVGFQPDFCWLKTTGAVASHALFDSVRGTNNVIQSNTANAAGSDSGAGFSAFDSDGFTVIEQVSAAGTINAASGMISWNWKAGSAPTADNTEDAGATPTADSVKIDGSNLGSALAGSIAATRLSANTTSGFSIVKYTGSGSIDTVAHGLGVAPEVIIFKKISSGVGDQWRMFNENVGNTYAISFSEADQFSASSTWWNDTSPTPSVFTVGTGVGVNHSGYSFIAYCFHSVEDYSKFGEYEGNNSTDGTFIYTGFKPAYLMCKAVSSNTNWDITTGKIPGYNQIDERLVSNTSAALESTGYMDFVSNGAKMRNTNSSQNAAETYIYLAFAESPFKTANAR